MENFQQGLMLAADWSGIMENLIIDSILDSMSDSLLVIGQDGNILYANKITKEILGYSADELKEKGLAPLVFSNRNNHDFNQIFVDAVWKKSINDYAEVSYHHPDGSVRRLAATTSYLLTEGQRETTFVGFIALFKDITEISRLRVKEKELTLEKERIAHEKIRSLHRLAMGVAHEIRNPIVTIGGFAGRILKDQKTSAESKQYARNIIEDARKLEKVVDETQAYCNLPEAKLSEGSVAQVVAEAVSEMAPVASSRNIAIQLHNSLPNGYMLVFDPLLLKMAIRRLLDNALVYSSDGSQVDVSLYATDHDTVFEVRDYGIGIDEQDREFIFNPFFSTRIHASGMGLAIVERIIHEHMGRIDVDSSLGQGTMIRIMLPHL
jgi:PAS domain S-box-containing protein